MKTAGSIKLLSVQNNVTFNYKCSEKLYPEKSWKEKKREHF